MRERERKQNKELRLSLTFRKLSEIKDHNLEGFSGKGGGGLSGVWRFRTISDVITDGYRLDDVTSGYWIPYISFSRVHLEWQPM